MLKSTNKQRPVPLVAYVYPPEMRATRDLLRRRTHFVRKRAELYAHIHNTAIQYNLPELGVHLATESNRKEVDQHFPDMQVRKIVQIDLAMSPVLTAMLRQDQSRRFEWDG